MSSDGRIASTFDRLRAAKTPGLVTYVTAGDPDLARSDAILRALDRAGADVLEVGVPFSDPLADGPVIQRATERALASGTTLSGVLDLLERLRPGIRAPFVVFSYANPILRLGVTRFADRARAAGVDGVLVLDLPIEEADSFRNVLAARRIDTILLLSPTTTDDRLRKAGALGSGFLYAISRLGVTGARDRIAAGAREMVERIRRVSRLPVALGFGISSPEHVREVGQWADAAVVGTALQQHALEARLGAHPLPDGELGLSRNFDRAGLEFRHGITLLPDSVLQPPSCLVSTDVVCRPAGLGECGFHALPRFEKESSGFFPRPALALLLAFRQVRCMRLDHRLLRGKSLAQLPLLRREFEGDAFAFLHLALALFHRRQQRIEAPLRSGHPELGVVQNVRIYAEAPGNGEAVGASRHSLPEAIRRSQCGGVEFERRVHHARLFSGESLELAKMGSCQHKRSPARE